MDVGIKVLRPYEPFSIQTCTKSCYKSKTKFLLQRLNNKHNYAITCLEDFLTPPYFLKHTVLGQRKHYGENKRLP